MTFRSKAVNNQVQEPQPKPGILEIDMYVPGKSKVPAGVTPHKLSSNESPLGPSSSALEALAGIGNRLQDYPDGQATALREAIAARHGLNPENIICGNGSDEILSMLANAFLAPGDEAIFTEHGFLLYRILTLGAGAKPVVVRETDCRTDVDRILEAVTDRTRIVFIANPNNPTGTYLPANEVKRLHANLPGNVILVLDAAYAEYVRRNDYESGLELVSESSNVVMTRTFSKIHGLAALRIGWAYGPKKLLDILNRIRGPFNMNSAAIAAGAAAIQDRGHVERSVLHNEEWQTRLTEGFEELGLKVTPSVGNFLLVHFPETAGKTAAEADTYLTERGFVLRAVGGYGFPNALRMSIGSAEANLGVLKHLKEFLD